MSEKTELSNTVVMPLVTPEQAKAQWSQYEKLKASVLSETDFQKIGTDRYTKKSGFRKIATFFGLSDVITEKTRVDRPDGSFIWSFIVSVTAPNGRVTQGIGSCDSRERNFAHLEHDVFSTAHTRAKNRGISDMVAGGEVSAEEMEAKPEFRESTVEPQPDDGSGVFDLASLNSFLLNNEIELVYKDKPISEEVDGILRVFSPPGSKMYEKANTLLRELNFEWIKGGYRWERTA